MYSTEIILFLLPTTRMKSSSLISPMQYRKHATSIYILNSSVVLQFSLMWRMYQKISLSYHQTITATTTNITNIFNATDIPTVNMYTAVLSAFACSTYFKAAISGRN